VKDNKQATAGNLIWQLNPVIRALSPAGGSKKTPEGGPRDLRQPCWPAGDTKQTGTLGTGELLHTRGPLRSAGRPLLPEETLTGQHFSGGMPIKRHFKIQGTANPYDPHWEGVL
jgi:hypothetical protein